MPSEINSVESYVVQDTSLSKYPEKSFDLTKIDLANFPKASYRN